ncbi:MAG: hypothetical protein ACRCZF_02935, partial [Gemmataceae bacterium]
MSAEPFFIRQARKLMRRPVAPRSTRLEAMTLESREVPSISGLVFEDYNANGKFDTTSTINNNGNASKVATAIDRGFGGITVTAFDPTGGTVSATTKADGTYTLPTTAGVSYRIE